VIDLALPGFVALCLGAALIFPGVLMVLARVPVLRARNAWQFALSVAVLAIALGVVAWWWEGSTTGTGDVVVGLMLLGSGLLVELEVWALLSRGYTLGLLLTLLNAEERLDARRLAQAYRGGAGLGWIMEHRLAGLDAARLIRAEDGMVRLTAGGYVVGVLYRMAVRVLGLARSG
jgi:hypothetical protein